MKFRKKPVVIEAIQVRAGEQPHELASDVIAGNVRYPEDGTVLIRTLEGEMLARPGDWIIRGVKGELYPCKPDIFEATYERANGSTALFCSLCFANDVDGGSWGGGVIPSHCLNCGAGGSVVTLPTHAIEAIRKNASWVGKRYYASDEDYEINAELVALRATVTEFPGRSAEEYTDSMTGSKHWSVRQDLGGGRSVSQLFPRLDGETVADGIAKARSSLPYIPSERLS